MNRLWIARDEDNKLYLYGHKPTRLGTTFKDEKDDGIHNGFLVKLPGDVFPEVTWENSPKQLMVKGGGL